MSNETENRDDAKVWELIENLHKMNSLVSYPIRQFVTCLLSGFFVVGILLIIPALVQTAAAYIWASQVRKEIPRHICVPATISQQTQSSASSPEPAVLSTTVVNTVRKMLSKQDRTLFLYRLLACTASLLVLIFSTLPQLVFVISQQNLGLNLDQLWGWCHAIVYADYASRCFATYLIVIPFGLMFWNYLFSEIHPRHNLLTENVFRVILRAAIPIAAFSILTPVIFVSRQYTPLKVNEVVQCGPDPHGLVAALYYDFTVTRIVPVFFVTTVGAGFLRWLPRNDYGVFYEPGMFLVFVLPHMLAELFIHIFHRVDALNHLVERSFSNFMLVAYSFYHMSFSCTFVLATMRSVISEIREEMRRRQVFFLGDIPDSAEKLHGTKRQTDMITGLQKQFSVAFRWKPDFTEEETRTFIENPMHAVLSENTEGCRGTDELKLEEAKRTDDAMLHYAILQRSAHLKRTGAI